MKSIRHFLLEVLDPHGWVKLVCVCLCGQAGLQGVWVSVCTGISVC